MERKMEVCREMCSSWIVGFIIGIWPVTKEASYFSTFPLLEGKGCEMWTMSKSG